MKTIENLLHEMVKENQWSFKDDGEHVNAIINPDRSDEPMSVEDLLEILEADDPDEALKEKTKSYYNEYDWFKDICNRIANAYNKEIDSDEEPQDAAGIYEYLYESDEISIGLDVTEMVDYFRQQEYNVVCSLDCQGEPEYWYHPWDEQFSKENWPAAFMLKELSDATDDSFEQEYENRSGEVNCPVVLCKLTAGDLIDIAKARAKKSDKTFEGVKFPKNAMGGFFDPINGGGSVLEMEFTKDFIIPAENIHTVLPDGKNSFTTSWSLDSVYGLCGYAWKEGEPIWKGVQ